MKQGDEDWLAYRRLLAVTMSCLGNAIGCGHQSPAKYMRIKLGMDPEPEENWMMVRGRERENWVVTLYSYTMRHELGYDIGLHEDAIRAWEGDRRIGGSPDRLVHDRTTGEWWVLECKTCYRPELRDHIPVTHLLQMLGLATIYGYNKAHYICWLEGVGMQLFEVRWTIGFWNRHIYPLVKEFCDMWTLRQVPGRLPAGFKQDLIDLINQHTIVSSIAPRQAIPKRLADCTLWKSARTAAEPEMSHFAETTPGEPEDESPEQLQEEHCHPLLPAADCREPPPSEAGSELPASPRACRLLPRTLHFQACSQPEPSLQRLCSLGTLENDE